MESCSTRLFNSRFKGASAAVYDASAGCHVIHLRCISRPDVSSLSCWGVNLVCKHAQTPCSVSKVFRYTDGIGNVSYHRQVLLEHSADILSTVSTLTGDQHPLMEMQ